MAVLTARVAMERNDISPVFILDDGTPVPTASASLPFRQENLDWVRASMTRVVDIGTGTRARLAAIEVAGKTGTAQNSHGEDHAWFVCFAPASAPEVAFVVILENAGHGGSQAAPVAARWLAAYFALQARREGV
jgi:penicillin-binding protein 2